MEFGDWKAAELGAEEMTAEVHGEKEMAIASLSLRRCANGGGPPETER